MSKSRAAYMREYRKRRKTRLDGPAPYVSYVDVPVVDGVATLPDGSTVRSSSEIVRVAIPHNLPAPPIEPDPAERIAELEAEVARLKRALAQANRDAILRKVGR